MLFAGSASGIGGYLDGQKDALFNGPVGIEYFNESLYVIDNGNNLIRKLSIDGFVTTFFGNQNDDTLKDETM